MARRRSHARRYYQNPPRSSSKSSGMSDGTKVALVVGGLAVVAGIGYLVYQNQSSSQTASGGAGGTVSSGQQSYQLGPGGSSAALPASGMSSDGTTIVGSTAYGPEAGSAPPVSSTIELG